MKRRIPPFPLWAAYMTFGQSQRLGENTVSLPIRVITHRRRMMLWALLTGRIRLSRP